MSRRRIKRRIKLDGQARDAIHLQLLAFKKKFGRDPGPDDPVFFDPDADTPQFLNQNAMADLIQDAMVKAGIEPAKIYAFRKTGMLLSEDNLDKWTRSDLKKWADAVEEFDALQRETKQ